MRFLRSVFASKDDVGVSYPSGTKALLEDGNDTSDRVWQSKILAAFMNAQLAGKQDVIDDLATIRSNASQCAAAYRKPASGIPKSDLASVVQTSLSKADTALQPSDLNTLNGKVVALESLISEGENPTAAIDKFNEIVAFLANITTADTLAGIVSGINDAIAAKYTKPSGGIPKSDLAAAVQTSLSKADTALQSHQSLTNLGIGNVKNYDQSKAIKGIVRNGLTFTFTCLDGTTGTFTQQDSNTTYGEATTSVSGLMSAADKEKLDGLGNQTEYSGGGLMNGHLHLGNSTSAFYGLYWGDASYCYMKEDVDDHMVFYMEKGTSFKSNKSNSGYQGWVFDNDVTATAFVSNVATGTAPLTVVSQTVVENLNADMLDGKHANEFAASEHSHSQYLTSHQSLSNCATLANLRTALGYAGCSTAAATAAKTVTITPHPTSLTSGMVIFVRFTYDNTASNATLKVNSLTAKAIYYNGSAVGSSVIKAGSTWALKYDGSYWQLLFEMSAVATKDEATTSKAGLMSAADKKKLNELNAADFAAANHTHSGYAASNHTHSQYLTEHQDISGKLNKTEVTSASALAAAPSYVFVQDSSGNIRRMTVANFLKYVVGDHTFVIDA